MESFAPEEEGEDQPSTDKGIGTLPWVKPIGFPKKIPAEQIGWVFGGYRVELLLKDDRGSKEGILNMEFGFPVSQPFNRVPSRSHVVFYCSVMVGFLQGAYLLL